PPRLTSLPLAGPHPPLASLARLSAGPHLPVRKTISDPRRLFDCDAVARFHRRHVPSAPDDDRIIEVFVKMIDVLDDAAVHRGGDGDVVEHREMLDVFTQADAAGVRTHWHAELRCQQ